MSAPTSSPRTEQTAVATGFDPFFLGVRAPLPGVGGRSVVELAFTRSTVQLDTGRALAACAAVNVDGAALVEPPLAGDWRADHRVPAAQQTGDALYADNALARAHLVCPRQASWGDRATAERAGADTFHHVNAVPQVAVFNRSEDLWLGLATHVLTAAPAARARLSVLTGPVLADDDPIHRGVGVPRRFFTVVAWADARGGALAATGYVLDQSALLTRAGIAAPLSLRSPGGGRGLGLGAYRTYQVPITSVEEITGLDLGPVTDADRLPTRADALGDGLEPAGWVELDGVEAITL